MTINEDRDCLLRQTGLSHNSGQRCHHINHIKGPQYLVISKLYFASPSGKETDIIKTTVKRLFFLPENGTKAAGKGIDI